MLAHYKYRQFAIKICLTQQGNTFHDLSACPFIFQPPRDTTATFGKSATFYCDGIAIDFQSIKWRKGNSIIVSSQKYSLANKNRKLVINNVNEDDIGEYKCTVRGVHGQTSATASLISVNGKYSCIYLLPLYCSVVCVFRDCKAILYYFVCSIQGISRER